MKILLLEDELMLQSSIEEYLDALGHIVKSFSSGRKAIKILEEETFDILVLDINVPHIDGFELLEILSSRQNFTPVIFISALLDIEDISRAFELGASDYLKKPFHLKELGLRINKIIRQLPIQSKYHIMISKNYSYFRDKNEFYYYTKVQTLTKKQSLILELLCKNIGMNVSFDQFRAFAWNHEPVDNATIRAEISRLRRTLKEDFIQNIKGVGYRVERYIKV